ncbi:hypothetical protein R5R35_004366 [Gryllus longicercus]|uniref:Uncharacterized protein n=1 Tax=Gryllus longicercus TaxID=2509291 RepID=A0AAN9YZ27_9ORTH
MASAADSIPWMDDPTWTEGTSPTPEESGVSGDSPAVLAGIVVGVLATMSLLFLFALLIDCRNQQAEAAKRQSEEARAVRRRRRVFRLPAFFRGRGANGDGLAFASQVCEENRNTNPVLEGNSSTVVDITEPKPSSSSVLQC